MGSSSPNRSDNKKYVSCHHLVFYSNHLAWQKWWLPHGPMAPGTPAAPRRPTFFSLIFWYFSCVFFFKKVHMGPLKQNKNRCFKLNRTISSNSRIKNMLKKKQKKQNKAKFPQKFPNSQFLPFEFFQLSDCWVLNSAKETHWRFPSLEIWLKWPLKNEGISCGFTRVVEEEKVLSAQVPTYWFILERTLYDHLPFWYRLAPSIFWP